MPWLHAKGGKGPKGSKEPYPFTPENQKYPTREPKKEVPLKNVGFHVSLQERTLCGSFQTRATTPHMQKNQSRQLLQEPALLLLFHIFAIATTACCSTSRWRRHSAAAKTLENRRCGLHEGSEFGTYALQLDQVESIVPVWQTTFRVLEKTSVVRRACYEGVERVRLRWSSVRAVLYRSSRAAVLAIVRRARAVLERSSRRVCHGQACAQCSQQSGR